MVFCGLYPVEGDDFSSLAGGAGEAPPERFELLHLPARVLRGPRASGSAAGSSACCTWRSSGSAWSGSSTSPLIATAPSVQYIMQEGERRRHHHRQPQRAAAGHRGRGHRGALPHHHDPHARRPTPARSWSCASSDGASMVKLEYLSPERMELVYEMPSGRGRHRLLRPAEEPHPGLRQPRLRALGLPSVEPGEGRHPPQRRPGRRLLDDRAQGQGVQLRPAHDRQAQGADPPVSSSTCRSRPPSAGGSSPGRR